jgi:hypothetical protein
VQIRPVENDDTRPDDQAGAVAFPAPGCSLEKEVFEPESTMRIATLTVRYTSFT